MRILKPRVIIFNDELDIQKLKDLELFGRICYRSHDRVNEQSWQQFLKRIVESGHHSILEHRGASVVITCDRGISHEIVRHRIASYSQESTRYCNYSKEKFPYGIEVIEPSFGTDIKARKSWKLSCQLAEYSYLLLLKYGIKPEIARGVLPTSLATRIVVTFNFREWRHFFSLRASAPAHPQMRQIAIPLLLSFREKLPIIFDDIDYDKNFAREEYAQIEFLERSEFLNDISSGTGA